MAKLTNSPAETTVLEVEARKSFALTVEVTTPAGAPADLTGAAVVLAIGTGETTAEHVATIAMPLSGRAVLALQAADLDLAPRAYPFVIVLRTGGYSLTLAKGELRVLANPEHASAEQTYGGGEPSTGLSVALAGLKVVRVTVYGGVPAGVGAGLDATGVPAAFTPVAHGDDTWAWAAVEVDWSQVTGTEHVVTDAALATVLDDYALLSGATFTGAVAVPELVAGTAAVEDLTASLNLTVGPDDDVQLSLAYGTVSAYDGGATPVLFPTGISDLPAPVDDDDAATKGYVDSQLASTGWTVVPGWDSVNWTYYSGTSTAPGTNKTGRTVEWRATLKPNSTAAVTALSGTTAGATPICTLPSELRPSTNVYSIQQGSGSDRYLLTIATNGVVAINRYGPGTASTSTWLPMYVNYISAA